MFAIASPSLVATVVNTEKWLMWNLANVDAMTSALMASADIPVMNPLRRQGYVLTKLLFDAPKRLEIMAALALTR